MKTFFIAIVLFCSVAAKAQKSTPAVLQKAIDTASASHKNILIEFSGSDWCIPCIKKDKAIFQQSAFKSFADTSLVVLHADFPRVRKLSKAQKAANEQLAELYNKQGSFPLTVLLDNSGKVLKTWSGYKDMTADTFVSEIRALH